MVVVLVLVVHGKIRDVQLLWCRIFSAKFQKKKGSFGSQIVVLGSRIVVDSFDSQLFNFSLLTPPFMGAQREMFLVDLLLCLTINEGSFLSFYVIYTHHKNEERLTKFWMQN